MLHNLVHRTPSFCSDTWFRDSGPHNPHQLLIAYFNIHPDSRLKMVPLSLSSAFLRTHKRVWKSKNTTATHRVSHYVSMYFGEYYNIITLVSQREREYWGFQTLP